MKLTKFIFNRLMGWKIDGRFDPKVLKSIIIVVPHTSWHDFYIGVFVRRLAKIEINFVGKKELFRPPFGWYFRWMGGEPVDRNSGQNRVESIAEIFKRKKEFRLGISPEGTRKKVDKWKTGFYYIAKLAEIPIIPVAFDYKTKTVIIHEPFYPTDNIDTDIKKLRALYEGVVGKNPKLT